MKFYQLIVPALIILTGLYSHAGGRRCYPTLRESLEPGLQSALKASLRKHMTPEFLEAIGAKQASAVLVDITTPSSPKVAAAIDVLMKNRHAD